MEDTLQSEEDMVLAWRQHQLERAGLPSLAAQSLASEKVDIEWACKVVRSVLAAGKDYELAVDILL